jgi:hypothetical protein
MYRLNYRTMTAEIKDKPKGKSRADDTRIDVRFPLSILQAIEQIAELEGAKIHHISGKRILTPTVIELVRIGLSQVSDKYQLEISAVKSDTLSGNISDNLTPRVEAIEGELADLKKLVDNLSVKLSDSLSETRMIELSDDVSDIIADNLPDAVADARADNLSDDISDIKEAFSVGVASAVPNRVVSTTDSNAPGGMVATPPPKKNPTLDSSQIHPRNLTQEVEGKGLTMAELVEKLGKTRQAIEGARDKGTLGEWGYRAQKVGRNWLYWAVRSAGE